MIEPLENLPKDKKNFVEIIIDYRSAEKSLSTFCVVTVLDELDGID